VSSLPQSRARRWLAGWLPLPSFLTFKEGISTFPSLPFPSLPPLTDGRLWSWGHEVVLLLAAALPGSAHPFIQASTHAPLASLGSGRGGCPGLLSVAGWAGGRAGGRAGSRGFLLPMWPVSRHEPKPSDLGLYKEAERWSSFATPTLEGIHCFVMLVETSAEGLLVPTTIPCELTHE
jgi:hypothetical protein